MNPKAVALLLKYGGKLGEKFVEWERPRFARRRARRVFKLRQQERDENSTDSSGGA